MGNFHFKSPQFARMLKTWAIERKKEVEDEYMGDSGNEF